MGTDKSDDLPMAGGAGLKGVGDEKLLSHRIGGDDASSYAVGAAAMTALWGSLYMGILSPFVTLLLWRWVSFRAAALFAATAVATVVVPTRHSARFCRFYLNAASCAGGATVWFPESLIELLKGDGFMACIHPHGILPLGFSFNGALRGKAMLDDIYLPKGVKLSPKVTGVEAPVLWRVPFIAATLEMLGACTPASKAKMKSLLASRIPFGILPGGSEEVAIHEHGKEHVYINNRYGFIKYGLEQGYALIVCYTFGESDQYTSLSWLRGINLWLVKRYGFVLPLFCGRPLCPLLPLGGGLHTVYGGVVQLPKIEAPTTEDVVKWHRVYVETLKSVFDTHKAKFGYGDRELHLF
eukprot:TRINITY_DN16563_c0_g1_i1.p1 TRINITY_DN16563_c0_g1~~TRINITY_DN16563_c0_g1_i1.p1  ORF type:complete len:353 (-),score=75.87 TRINITY_DN16563_c0_g1_i1:125-1183(-)